MSFTVPAPTPTPTPAPAPTPNPAPAPVVPTAFTTEDGSFVENWHLRPEMAEYKGIERFKTLPEMAKGYQELERAFSQRQPVGVMVPGADAKPEVIAAYRKEIGVPDSPDKYDLKPKELPKGITWDETRGAEMAKLFHAEGVPAGVASKIVEAYLKGEVDHITALQTQHDNLMADREAELKKEWGSEYNQKLATVKQVVGALGFDSSDAELFGNPKVLGFLGKMVGMLSEDSVASIRATIGSSPGEYVSGAAEARAIQLDTNHPEHARFMAGDPAVIKKVERLYAQG